MVIMLMLIIANLFTLGLYIVIHREVSVISDELIRTQEEVGYQLWSLESRMKGELVEDE